MPHNNKRNWRRSIEKLDMMDYYQKTNLKRLEAFVCDNDHDKEKRNSVSQNYNTIKTLSKSKECHHRTHTHHQHVPKRMIQDQHHCAHLMSMADKEADDTTHFIKTRVNQPTIDINQINNTAR